MNFEPQKFVIGLIDFFSILLPGALLTYLLKDKAGPLFLGGDQKIVGTEGWMVFLFSSYLLGHFIFLLGSWLDEVYDVLRRASLKGHIWQLAWRGTLPKNPLGPIEVTSCFLAYFLNTKSFLLIKRSSKHVRCE